jgi:SNF2 family DNA or RNA helicase
MVQRGKTSLWAKPGSGKTVVGATAISDSFEFPCLLLATKRICELVWRQELDRWEHLAHLDAALLFGSPGKREVILSEQHDFYLLNYELLPWLCDTLKGHPWPFRSVMFDEISKMKHPGTRRFKKLRHRINESGVRFGLTGSPRGNSMLGLWGQTFMTNGPVLAPTMTAYKSAWFRPVDKEMRVWRPNPGAEEALREMAKPYAYSIPRSTAADEAKIRVVSIEMSKRTRQFYEQIDKELELEIEGHHIIAVEPGVRRGKKLQICSGAIYVPGKKVLHLHDAKMDALLDIHEEMQGQPLLVFYRFRHELERMQQAISGIKTINSVDSWINEGGTLAVHPQSAAHGLNLHVGGASTMVWFTLPDSQEMWEQGNRRLARTGQTEEVTSLVLSTRGTDEELISTQLERHGRLQDLLIDTADEEHHG